MRITSTLPRACVCFHHNAGSPVHGHSLKAPLYWWFGLLYGKENSDVTWCHATTKSWIWYFRGHTQYLDTLGNMLAVKFSCWINWLGCSLVQTVTANRCSKSCTITCNRNMKQSHDAFWREQNTKQSVMPALPISATTHTAGLFASGAGAACPRWRTCLLLVVAVLCASVQESNGFYPSIQFRVGDQSTYTDTATQLHGDWFLTSFCFTIGHEIGMCLAVECISSWGPGVRDES